MGMMKFALGACAAVIVAGGAGLASAATYGSEAAFDAANPGLATVGFSDVATGLTFVGSPYVKDGLTFEGPDLKVVDTSFWGSVDSLLDDTFEGYIAIKFTGVSAIGFYLASSYSTGGLIDLEFYNNNSLVVTHTVAGGGVNDSFSFFGIDGIGTFDQVRLNTTAYANGFSSVGPITIGVQTAVPEPGAWALMIMGFGFAGATLRRRRPALA